MPKTERIRTRQTNEIIKLLASGNWGHANSHLSEFCSETLLHAYVQALSRPAALPIRAQDW